LDDTDEQLGEGLAVFLAVVVDRAEIELLVGSEIAEGYVRLQESVELPGAAHTDGVAEHEHLEKYDRVITWSAAAIVPGLR
jgi:hypothetical protein